MQYSTLFTLDCRHLYRTDGICKSIALEPTPSTYRLMKQYKLLWRKQGSTYHVLCSYEANKAPLLLEETKAILCSFNIKNTDPQFINYTDLLVNKESDKHYYFSNKKNISKQNIAQEEHVSDQDMISDAALSPRDFGLIEIHVSPNDFTQEGSIPAQIKKQEYHIFFKNRATYWRYILINSNDYELGNYKISSADGKSNSSFTDAQSIQLQNGQAAVQFTSTEAIPLMEKNETFFKLQMNKIEGNQVNRLSSSLRLPSADSSLIKPIRQTDGALKIFSDIYVYL